MTLDGIPNHALVKCRLCGDLLDPEHPTAQHNINPQTFRVGWMHLDCFRDATDALSPAERIRYDDFWWANSK